MLHAPLPQGLSRSDRYPVNMYDRIAIAHTSPGGRLSQPCLRWRAAGMDVWMDLGRWRDRTARSRLTPALLWQIRLRRP